MSAAPPILHGGRLDLARRLFPDAPLPWIDLSTGVSPYPYPLPDVPMEAYIRLPDAEAQSVLEAVAARAYRAAAGAELVAAAGVQALIQCLPRIFPARRVAILGLTYEEHAVAWRAGGATVERVLQTEELAHAEVGVVVNPNNPDGRLEPAERLAALAKRLAERGGLLVVDEAFIDLAPAQSLAPFAGAPGLVVLRSFGKAFGLPGLRLGFALCDEALAARLRAALGPWSVCGPALAIGGLALSDESWLVARAAQLGKDVARLDALLKEAQLDIVGGTALFRLARCPGGAGWWFAHLGRCGILTRGFGERPDWLRFGLPATPEAWERLAQALESGHDACRSGGAPGNEHGRGK
jgi:cobalamin biosynthetic protein CobC